MKTFINNKIDVYCKSNIHKLNYQNLKIKQKNNGHLVST